MVIRCKQPQIHFLSIFMRDGTSSIKLSMLTSGTGSKSLAHMQSYQISVSEETNAKLPCLIQLPKNLRN